MVASLNILIVDRPSRIKLFVILNINVMYLFTKRKLIYNTTSYKTNVIREKMSYT